MKMHGVASLLLIGFISACGSNKSSDPMTSSISPADNARIHNEGLDIPVVSLTTAEPVAVPLVLRQIAQIDPPRVGDYILQATDIVVDHSYAFVSYSYQGPIQMGAIDIIDISDLGKLKLRSQLLFKDRDVNAIDLSDHTLYFVGAARDERDGPAYLGKVSIQDGIFSDEMVLKPIDGFSATDVIARKSMVFVAAGDRSGVFGFTSRDLELVIQEKIHDARALAADLEDPDSISVLTGTPAELLTFKTNAFSEEKDWTFEMSSDFLLEGAMTPESHSSLQLGQFYALASQGEAGFSLVCRENGKILASVPVDASHEIALEDRVTNAVSTSKGIIYAANGGAGVITYRSKIDTAEKGCHEIKPQLLGRLNFGEYISANQIYTSGNFIFVATGRGGLRVLSSRPILEEASEVEIEFPELP